MIHTVFRRPFITAFVSFSITIGSLAGAQEIVVGEKYRLGFEWIDSAVGDCKIKGSKRVHIYQKAGESKSESIPRLNGVLRSQIDEFVTIIDFNFDERAILLSDTVSPFLGMRDSSLWDVKVFAKSIEFEQQSESIVDNQLYKEFRSRYPTLNQWLFDISLAWQCYHANRMEEAHDCARRFEKNVVSRKPEGSHIVIGFPPRHELTFREIVQAVVGDHLIERAYRKWSDPSISDVECIANARNVLRMTSKTLNPQFEELHKFVLDLDEKLRREKCFASGYGDEIAPNSTKLQTVRSIVSRISAIPGTWLSPHAYDTNGLALIKLLSNVEPLNLEEIDTLSKSIELSKVINLGGGPNFQKKEKILTIGELMKLLVDQGAINVADK